MDPGRERSDTCITAVEVKPVVTVTLLLIGAPHASSGPWPRKMERKLSMRPWSYAESRNQWVQAVRMKGKVASFRGTQITCPKTPGCAWARAFRAAVWSVVITAGL